MVVPWGADGEGVGPGCMLQLQGATVPLLAPISVALTSASVFTQP